MIENIGPFDVKMGGPKLMYPVLRAESREQFDQLLKRDERNVQYLPADEAPVESIVGESLAPAEDEPVKLNEIVLYLGQEPPQKHEPDPEPPVSTANFRITDDYLGEDGVKAKYRGNIEAISLLKLIECEHRYATPVEQETLSRYVGWGGLPLAFDGNDTDWTNMLFPFMK